MSECELCDGTLQVGIGNEANGRIIYEPCPACLTYAATDDVRDVAREWLGFLPWVADYPWWSTLGARVLPLHLPAGRDLAVRVLARRLGLPPEASVWFRAIPTTCSTWVLATCVPGEPPHVWYFGQGSNPSPPDSPIPSRTIPTDAPAELRAARALVLCLQATEP